MMERWCKIIEQNGRQYLFTNTNKEDEEAKMTIATIMAGIRFELSVINDNNVPFKYRFFEDFATPEIIEAFEETLKQAKILD